MAMSGEQANRDLSVKFAGLTFPNPFILSSAPPTTNGEMIRRAFQAGWGGAVSKTLNPEGVVIRDVTPRLATMRDARGAAFALGNIELTTKRTLGEWVRDFDALKEEFPDRIIIASLMAETSRQAWQDITRRVQGHVDAVELNLSCPHGMPEKGMGMAVGQDPAITEAVVGWVKEVATVPVLVKLTANVTDLAPIVEAAERAGADAFVAINTVSAIMGVDLDTLTPLPAVKGRGTFCGYSGPGIKPIGLRCVAQIAQVTARPISAVGGIETWQDAVEYMAVGASTVQLCTAVMFRGYRIVRRLRSGLSSYLQDKGFAQVEDIVGKALGALTAHEELDFDHRVVYRIDEERCTDCGICITSCRDAGYSAIDRRPDRPQIDPQRCDGCSLCQQVCPVEGCVTPVEETRAATA